MAYNLIVTDEMDKLLENCVNYILRKLKNEQASSHLLDEVEKIYDEIEDNPGIYPVSDDPFLAALTYHEAVLHGMNYKIIYKYDDETVYILGIYHDLENYVDKIQQLWGSLNGTLQLLTKLNEAKISIKDEGTISADDIEKKLGL